jgi:DNA-directed RNA polymerase subunit beta'
MPYINGLLKKKGIGQLVNYCYLQFGLETTVRMLDEIKDAGLQVRPPAPAFRSASTTWSSRTPRTPLVRDADRTR